jgi:hypothetical protein
MKATIPQLKAKIKKLSECTGLVLTTSNPYWANEKQLGYMQDAYQSVIREGNESPDRRYTPTPKQIESLDNWFFGLKQKYLH